MENLVLETLARALPETALSTDAAAAIWTAETRTLVRDTIERIVVRGSEIEIMLKKRIGEPNSTMAEDDENATGERVLKTNLPAPRPRARKAILLPGGSGSGPRHVDHALVLALARARSWMRALRAGDFTETTKIAQRFGLSDPHVRRLLRFAYLAPDIVEAIVEGRQPRNLTVKRLLHGIPSAWSDQRAEFGFGR